MNRFLRSLLSLILSGILMLEALADDGALPRGKTAAPGRKILKPEGAPQRERLDCASYLSNPDNGELYFADAGKLVYFLSRQPGDITGEGKSLLFKVDLGKLQTKRIVSLRTGATASIIGHGQPMEAVSVLDFRNVSLGCGEGTSAGIGIKWVGKQRIIKSYPLGSYKIVPSDQGQLLADMDQRIIKALDLNTYQKRSIASFYEKELPLYLKVTPLQVLAFRPEQRELVRYEAQSSEPVASLKLKSGMRLVQQDGLFGIVTASEDGKTLQVKQIKGWSGDVFRGIDIKLPEDFQADRVGVAADFGSGLCLVFGGNSNIRRKLRQILVVNGSKEQSTQLIKAPEAQYFSQVLLTPESHKILILSRGLQDESVKTLRLGDPVTGEWKELAINYDMNSNKVDEAPVSKKDI